MKLSLCLLLFLLVLAPGVGAWSRRPVLKVTVSRATGLRGDGWFGRTDGYAKATAAGTTCVSRTIYNNNNPYWGQTLSFPPRSRSGFLSLQVWDKDRGRDDCLGSCKVRIVRSTRSRSHSCRIGWRGRLYFSYRYY